MLVQTQYNIPKTERLGEILVKRGLVTTDKIKKALKIQKKEKKYLGEILVQLGYIDERDIVIALVIQCHLPYIAIDKYQIDFSIVNLVPREMAQRCLVMPLDRVGNVLSLVMANPLDCKTRQELQNYTHCRIAPFIGMRVEIEKAINHFYGME